MKKKLIVAVALAAFLQGGMASLPTKALAGCTTLQGNPCHQQPQPPSDPWWYIASWIAYVHDAVLGELN